MVKKTDNTLSCFHLIPERYGQTDRQTGRIAISILRVSVLTRKKNLKNDTNPYSRLYSTHKVESCT